MVFDINFIYVLLFLLNYAEEYSKEIIAKQLKM